ncbi:MAG TPA: flagellar protein FlaG [Paenalcaligenes sp.]|nr:flagellar protein FlaG [Paenalcaligenes sp.]
MVKPIPIHHAIHIQQQPQEAHLKQEANHVQTELAVSKPVETLGSKLSPKNTLPNSIENALKQLNEEMRPWATAMQFEIDPDLERLVISIIDNETGEVLRSIPSEALLQIAKMITSFQGQSVNTHV